MTNQMKQRYNHRILKDRLARGFVSVGGISIIVAILLIFFYLLQVVIPMFESAEITESQRYEAPGEGGTLILGLEEQGTVGVRITDQGHVVFFDTTSGDILLDEAMTLPAAVSSASNSLNRVVLGLENGTALVLQYEFKTSYPDNIRTLTPEIVYPLGKQFLELDASGQPLLEIALQMSSDGAGLAAFTADNRLVFSRYVREESFMSEEITTELESRSERQLNSKLRAIALSPALSHLYVASDEGILFDYPLNRDGFSGADLTYPLTQKISSLQLLLGGASLLVGLENGEVQQWMQVRQTAESGSVATNDKLLTFIRSFQPEQDSTRDSLISAMATEQRRKGFSVANTNGEITIYYSTSHRTLAHIGTAEAAIKQMTWSARAQHLLVADSNNLLYLYDVHNEYPEVSWDILWGKVWYEGYDEPDYIWQSSASSNDFEPKLSLVPLSFGTLKAAFYAMLFAVPIAILGAIFTSQFMSPRMRQSVKPSIEIMEALPTVILGFLAGLWLAPYVETHLAGVFTLLLILPLGFILCAWIWGYVPGKSRFEGWEALLLIPVVLLLIGLSMSMSAPLEQWFFNGDMRGYMSQEWGLSYDQRNSLVVGLIMGFAVIPTIFSIAEDALFSVPQHLVKGSLALGATRWQTVVKVVLPAASPGIYSAVMMGFGRAVGETMIVLMATGNTPLMDMSIFQGMRTLAANIAVEVPEAEVASTHYRVLFLAAFVLFMFTFFFNTIAEMIRHRLRKRYSGL